MEFCTEFIPNVPVLYFISDTQGHAKVGIASDIKNRFTTLQVGSAYELKIIHLEYRDTYKEVQELEREYHAKLSQHRIRGEWFEENAVIDCLLGETKDTKEYMCDVCPEFDFMDLIHAYMIYLTSQSREEYLARCEKELPKYFSDFQKTRERG